MPTDRRHISHRLHALPPYIPRSAAYVYVPHSMTHIMSTTRSHFHQLFANIVQGSQCNMQDAYSEDPVVVTHWLLTPWNMVVYTMEPHITVTSLVRNPPHYSHRGSAPKLYFTVQITPWNKVTSPLRSLLTSPVGDLNSEVPLYYTGRALWSFFSQYL